MRVSTLVSFAVAATAAPLQTKRGLVSGVLGSVEGVVSDTGAGIGDVVEGLPVVGGVVEGLPIVSRKDKMLKERDIIGTVDGLLNGATDSAGALLNGLGVKERGVIKFVDEVVDTTVDDAEVGVTGLLSELDLTTRGETDYTDVEVATPVATVNCAVQVSARGETDYNDIDCTVT